MRSLRAPGVCLLAILLLGVTAPASTTFQDTGSIQGRITDSSGAVVPGVTVTARSASAAGEHRTATDSSGVYRLLGLAPGRYEVRAGLTGFKTAVIADVQVKAAAATKLDFTLEVGKLEETVIVQGATQAVQTQTATVQTTFRAEIGRRALDYVTAMPGVSGPGHPPYYGPPNTRSFDRVEENRFQRTTEQPLSTFAVDVDTASYAFVRRMLSTGTLPPRNSVRLEELINYFRYDYPDPKPDVPFSITTDVGPCPWNRAHLLAHIGLQARRLTRRETPPRNLVFLLDVSGSMEPADKLPLIKQGMQLLVNDLTPRDTVAIVVYATAAGVVLEPTSGDRRDVIRDAIDHLHAGGSTNGADGLLTAYRLARHRFDREGVNRVILGTDGDFNTGMVDRGNLVALIERERKAGIGLSILGVGTDNLKDGLLEQLADKGNGNYAYLDTFEEAYKVLVRQASATLITVAKDVKLQVEFNPAYAAAYRLLGYEDRALAAEDFKDDKKDAGEIGAGHSVTALYEIVPPEAAASDPALVDELKYQAPRAAAAGTKNGELMTVKLRYKRPESDTSVPIEVVVRMPAREGLRLSDNLGFSAAVAAFGMLLRNSSQSGDATWRLVADLATAHRGSDPDGYRAQFARLAEMAGALARTHETASRR